jgi:NDP-sugar pyrophosphorylase family protein
MLGVILAAGEGRRLQPITTSRPKAMIPVLGKPILARVMESLHAVGVNRFLIVVNPKADPILEYLSTQTGIPAPIDIVYQEKPLGMANALLCAADRIQGDFILSACDNLVNTHELHDLLTLWKQADSISGLLSLIPVDQNELSRVGVVQLEGTRVTRIIEKPAPESAPSLIASIPLYVFSTKILEYLEDVQPSTRGEFELQDAIQMQIDAGYNIQGFHMQGRQTVNTLAELLKLNLYYFKQQQNINVINSDINSSNVQLVPPVYIEAEVDIESDCTIGPRVFLERNCQIGAGSTLRNAVVLANAFVPPSSKIHDRIVN